MVWRPITQRSVATDVGGTVEGDGTDLRGECIKVMSENYRINVYLDD